MHKNLKRLAFWRNENMLANAASASPDVGVRLVSRNMLIERATLARERGDFSAALAILLDEAPSLAGDLEVMFAVGWTCYDWGRYRDAAYYLAEARARGIDHWSLFLKQGWCAYYAGDLVSARRFMADACKAAPAEWQPFFGAAAVDAGEEKWSASHESLRHALAIAPDNVACLASDANSLLHLGDLQESESVARTTLLVDPKCLPALTPLGIGLAKQHRYVEALEVFTRAKEVDDELGIDSGATQNLVNALIELGRSADAIPIAESSLRTWANAGTYANYAAALIADGRLEEGWPLFEYRWMKEPLLSARSDFSLPVWQGQDISGKRLLVRCEQGIGDFIQFVRYAPLLKALGATVHIQPREGVSSLAKCFAGVDAVLEGDAKTSDYSYFINLMSLPSVFGTDDATIPNQIPYVFVDRARIERWAERLLQFRKLRVGLVWRGNPLHIRDRYRSIDLRLLEPLLDIEGVDFFSLQAGPSATEIEGTRFQPVIQDFSAEFHEYMDTIAFMQSLDLVIGVDTSVIHAAGALGVPVWTLLAKCVDYRWKEKGDTTAWYPTMRLFRQEELGDWKATIEDLRTALSAFAANPPVRGSAKPFQAPTRHVDSAPRVLTFRPHGGIHPKWCPVLECREGLFQYRVDDAQSQSVGWYGEYGYDEVRMLAHLVRGGQRILELGSGFGAHSIPMARLVGPAGEVMLYERDVFLRRLLRQNLETNKISNCTIMRRTIRTEEAESGLMVESIDELKLRTLEWIKVTNPAEVRWLLSSASDSLWRLRPRLMLQVSDRASAEQCSKALREFGYSSWMHESTLYNPTNFFHIQQDIFAGQTTWSVVAIPEEIDVDVSMDPYVPIHT